MFESPTSPEQDPSREDRALSADFPSLALVLVCRVSAFGSRIRFPGRDSSLVGPDALHSREHRRPFHPKLDQSGIKDQGSKLAFLRFETPFLLVVVPSVIGCERLINKDSPKPPPNITLLSIVSHQSIYQSVVRMIDFLSSS